MTSDVLRAAIRSRPFVPFIIVMGDGNEHQVPHPEFLAMSRSGRLAYLVNADDTWSVLDLLLMTELRLEVVPQAPPV